MAEVKFRKHVIITERELAKLLGLGAVDDARVWVEDGGRWVHLQATVDVLAAGQAEGKIGMFDAGAGEDGWWRTTPEMYVDVTRAPTLEVGA